MGLCSSTTRFEVLSQVVPRPLQSLEVASTISSGQCSPTLAFIATASLNTSGSGEVKAWRRLSSRAWHLGLASV